jgi:hypothetical protein
MVKIMYKMRIELYYIGSIFRTREIEFYNYLMILLLNRTLVGACFQY